MKFSPRRVLIILALASLGGCSKSPRPGAEASDSSGSESDPGSETGPSPADLSAQTGTDGTGETDEPEPSCDYSGYLYCVEDELGPWTACLAECVGDQQSCLDDACEATCEPARAAAEATCEPLCPPSEEWLSPCDDQCVYERLACLAAGCGAAECDYDRYTCGYDCHTCATFEMDLAWAGSCELVPIGPPLPLNIPYTYIEVADEVALVAGPGATCDDPDNAAVFAPGRPPTSVVLCEAACQTFAATGTARLMFGAPACE